MSTERIDALLYGWMGGAVGNGPERGGVLAEDERGDLWVPSRTRADWWDREFNPRNPMHWRFWLAARRSHYIAMIELEEVSS